MEEYVQVITTTASQKEAERIARVLLEKRLVACVQIIGPIASLYWWQQKIERSEEWLCLAKTKSKLFAQVEETIKSLHSYEVPEILAVPIVKGSSSYLQWLSEQLHQTP
ncbi:MAG: divalent-cation tolerance protein CutA [Candidatus Bipolaricaulota bacterium]|nr:divalent-cation tolerance protein CutA [Candidatus Bipolaricaulota bacterium]MDW8031349.1 divalent-cation tolerance protein CutA [Candidatus Bipolaricaulota bacterium]